jgi:hypothetical protein
MTSDYRFCTSNDVGRIGFGKIVKLKRPVEWVTSTSLVQKRTMQLLFGLDHSRDVGFQNPSWKLVRYFPRESALTYE